ncbi:single-stranded-DNA-specific exonuclease RecJ [Terriglobus saanensis]|uniref:Single-stranded-DNA-specific exonuclease RecJ n=1 Tax=Terriglobus saanensis (strain ATCC BAA-1853 / DSM 23119 / SP1PR4) TaxID=401053 RepID=E8V5R3_TERSS|nr:single-stranded-DNA-specific exonuclease RecJ [Terriglobus saanensis]ADV82672.1 single-stranded-DNA-specific exonuclease RecJ [Terriglobus saanensis SP1PR4]
MALPARWVLPEVDPDAVAEIASSCTLPLPVAAMLVRRGISSAEEALRFLQPSLSQLHDPFLMLGMHEAVDRVLEAVLHREPILIYGDYDVDGTTATVLLKTAIDRITPKGTPSLVRFHIPHRILEGYGMQTSILAGAAEQGIRLVISVDTGIRAFAAADEARAQGMDLIVTDHHLPDDSGVPEAVAVLNPNQPGCPYPFKAICGAGVAFKLAHALLLSVAADPNDPTFNPISREALEEKFLPSFLKLLAIATIADSVPLNGENRAIVALGLEQLRRPNQAGLRALMQLSGFELENGSVIKSFNARDIAFRIAPRINAAGRMDTATDVVQLFLTRDPAEAQTLAEKLHALNTDRREAEARILEEVEAQIAKLRETDADLESHGVVVLDGEGWHRGVVGILASRVVERTGRPALVLAHEDGQAHGSGRSVAGFHLLDAITFVDNESAVFTRFGGHAFAVGFSLPSNVVPDLKLRLSAYSVPRLTPSVLAPTILLDSEVRLADIDANLLAAVRKCEPFGNDNPEPVFAAFGVTILDPIKTLKEKHAKLRVRQEDGGLAFAALCWSRSDSWPERLEKLGVTQGSKVDIAFRPRENSHPDFGTAIDLELCDIRLTDGTSVT